MCSVLFAVCVWETTWVVRLFSVFQAIRKFWRDIFLDPGTSVPVSGLPGLLWKQGRTWAALRWVEFAFVHRLHTAKLWLCLWVFHWEVFKYSLSHYLLPRKGPEMLSMSQKSYIVRYCALKTLFVAVKNVLMFSNTARCSNHCYISSQRMCRRSVLYEWKQEKQAAW